MSETLHKNGSKKSDSASATGSSPADPSGDDKISIRGTAITFMGNRGSKWLERHQGVWAPVASSQGVIILRNIDEQVAGDDGMVCLAGEITGRGNLTDVLNMLHSGRWEGSLHILSHNIRKTILMKNGDVVGAASNSPADRLGELLYTHGVIDREQLKQAVKEAQSPQRLGAVLISQGHITPHHLYSYLNKQVEEIFYSLLLLEEGSYYFRRRSLEDPAFRQLRVPMSSLLLEGARRIDEMGYFREEVRSQGEVFTKEGPPQAPALNDQELRILHLVDGKRDLQEIARLAHLNEYDVTRLVFRLVKAGIIKRRTDDHLGPLATHAQFAEKAGVSEIFKLINQVFPKMLGEAAAVDREAVLRGAPAAFCRAGTDFAGLFENVEVLPDGQLQPETLFDNLWELAAEDKSKFLYQGINEFLSFAIFLVVEELDPQKELHFRGRVAEIISSVKV